MIWIILGSVLLVLICAFFLLLRYAYKRVFYSPQKVQNSEFNAVRVLNAEDLKERANKLVTELMEIPYTDLTTKSYDNLNLHAYFYERKGSNEYIVFFHGFRRTARRSFAGRAMDCLALKKNVILVDHRAHGLSEGHALTFGKKERHDVLTWVKFIKDRFGPDAKITLVGVSMGGSAILFVADQLDPDVKIIADSPYISIKDVVVETTKILKMKPRIVCPLLTLSSLLFCHETINFDATEPVKKSKNKILIIHGTEDTLVPYKSVENLYLKNKEHIHYEVFDGMGHGLAYLRETEKYRKVFFDFINNN